MNTNITQHRTDPRFSWTPFYEELATKLLKYKNDRAPLVAEIHRIRSLVGLSELTDQFSDGRSRPLQDICPFSVLSTLNQKIKRQVRFHIAEELGRFLNVSTKFPKKNFEKKTTIGAPLLLSLNTWFFGYEKDRNQQDIPNLWKIFEAAINFAKTDDNQTRQHFIELYDIVIQQHSVGVPKFTIGLFWIRPWNFVSLEKNSYPYIETNLGISIPKSGPKKTCTAEDYLNLLTTLNNRFVENIDEEPHSFPELASAAYTATPETSDKQITTEQAEKVCWFVGASYNSDNDQADRFIREGIWQNGYKDKYLELIKSIQRGDRIAIKASYTKKYGLPFDNQGHTISVMAIKATGIVTNNHGDGRSLDVKWTPVNPPREWYFNTSQKTVWQVLPGNWKSDALINFTFNNMSQDYERFKAAANADSPLNTEQAEPVYSVTDIINDGCFLLEPELNNILRRLQNKQNLILQGPPGTGKTWLAKRLMYALSKTAAPASSQYSHMQFHANLSYEDFVQGYRPTEDGKLARVDGPFLQLSEQARKNPGTPHVMIIEEINRGHPAQIFGELLTLLETDKRDSKYALHLTHQQAANEPYFIPQNLYVIGTMNTADRSLALIDFAFRRRFAFIDMKPLFNEQWVNFVANRNGIQKTELHKIATTMQALNNTLRDTLGANFQVGHSYCTPPHNEPIADAAAWFNDIVTTELSPLLKEYWFDDPDKVTEEVGKLLKTFA